jgi:hypothetical protein
MSDPSDDYYGQTIGEENDRINVEYSIPLAHAGNHLGSHYVLSADIFIGPIAGGGGTGGSGGGEGGEDPYEEVYVEYKNSEGEWVTIFTFGGIYGDSLHDSYQFSEDEFGHDSMALIRVIDSEVGNGQDDPVSIDRISIETTLPAGSFTDIYLTWDPSVPSYAYDIYGARALEGPYSYRSSVYYVPMPGFNGANDMISGSMNSPPQPTSWIDENAAVANGVLYSEFCDQDQSPNVCYPRGYEIPDSYFYTIVARDGFYHTLKANSERASKFTIPFDYEKFLFSLPLQQYDTAPSTVLTSIKDHFSSVWDYDENDPGDPWKSYDPIRPDNDLTSIDHIKGLWIDMDEYPSEMVTVGRVTESTIVPIVEGWNLHGYPSFNAQTIDSALNGVCYDTVEVFSPTPPEYLRVADPNTDLMTPGNGYWISATCDTDWEVVNNLAVLLVASSP